MFKVNEVNYITSRELGSLLDLTSERVRQLEDEGIFSSITKSGKKYFDLAPSILAFINHLRSKINPQANELTAEQIALADLRYKTARAGKMELELQELQGTMHRAEDVEGITSDMIARLRGMILALPGQLAVDTADAKTAKETSAIIKRAVDDLLNEMAEYKYRPEDFRKLVMEREKWISVKEAETAEEELSKQKRTPAKKTSARKPAAKKPAAKKPAAKKVAVKKPVAKSSASKKPATATKNSSTASKRRKT